MPFFSSTTRKRRRKHRARTLIVVLIAATLSGSLAHVIYKERPERFGSPSIERQYSSVVVAAIAPRNIYPYSVIPGGANNAEELAHALSTDSVAANHYSDFRASRVGLVYAKFDQRAYVSYRKNNNVYWTKKRVRLDPGEMLLTDGKTFARTRCGNRLSDTPQKPTSESEPTEEALLFVPSFNSNKLIRLPADLEEAPPLGPRPLFLLPAANPIPTFEQVLKPVYFVPVTSGVTIPAPIPIGISPEPGTLILLISGGFVFVFFCIRRKGNRECIPESD